MKLKNIFLVGFRAVGKSTIAPILAQKLDYECVEMDEIIQQKTGQTILELTQNGTNWVRFRELETELLAELVTSNHKIVSCGGGCGVNDLTGSLQKKLLDSFGGNMIILLNTSEQVIESRLRKNYEQGVTHRQSLDGSQSNDINQKLNKDLQIYRSRLPLYTGLTQFYINTDQEIDLIVAKIMVLLQNYKTIDKG